MNENVFPKIDPSNPYIGLMLQIHLLNHSSIMTSDPSLPVLSNPHTFHNLYTLA